MPELRELERKMDSVKALGGVVDAMRNLAAIYVRRAEAAVEAVRPYSEVVETCLAVLLDRLGAREDKSTREEAGGPCLALVFAGDQGLCGPFNDRVARAALDFGREHSGTVHFVSIGRRGHDLLALGHVTPVLSVSAPTSLEGIRSQVPGLTADVYEAYGQAGATEMFFIYNAYEGMGQFATRVVRVLPPALGALEAGHARAFSYEPILTAAPQELLGRFAEEYFFIELYRALLESHCSESGARLVAMTSAGSNVGTRAAELTQAFHTARQDTITAELLDVVAGAESLRSA